MKGKAFYSDHIPYINRNEKKNYSMLWVNKDFHSTLDATAFSRYHGWMIKDGYLYDLKDRYTDVGILGPYKYKQITEPADDLFQGVNDITENEKIIIVDSKNVPSMMKLSSVHHYIPMFDGHAYSFDDDGHLKCWRVVDEIEIKKNEKPETPLHVEIHADGIPYHHIINQALGLEDAPTSNEPVRLDRVVYNDPATIAFWSDGTKTVVKCSPKDTYDPEKGLLLCIAKKLSDNGEDWYKKIQEKLPKTKIELKPTAIYDQKLIIDCDAPLKNMPALCTLIAKKIKYGYNRFEFKGNYATDVLKRIIAMADSQK